MQNFLTELATHRNNPTGAASLTTVASNIACTPIDPLDRVPVQDYPLEKLFLLHETYTKYAAFQGGDYLVAGGVTYAVRAVRAYAAQGGMDAYYQLMLEKQL